MKEVFNKKVMAIIVTYNRKELLKECINNLLNQDYKNCEVLVVDNASTDGTKEYITSELKNKKVHYVNTGCNLGGAGGFNYGMKKAYKFDCDYMWLMDDDCMVHNDSLIELLNASENLKEEYGFLASKVLWKDDSICKMNIPKKTFSTWLKDYDKNYQAIEMSSFVSLFLKSSIVKEFGLPIRDFFIWTDDWEYTRRISRKYKCYYISSSVVTHKSKQNIGASIAEENSERLGRFKYLYRNDCVLYRREGIKGKLLFKLRITLHKLRIYKSNKADKKDRIKIINEAIKNGKKFFPKIEYIDSNEKIKILEFFGEPLNYGGQEAFALNLYSKIDKNQFSYTFMTPFECTNKRLQKLILENNDKLIYDNNEFETPYRKKYIIDTAKKYINNGYDVIHIHSGSTYTLYNVAKLAKKRGINKVIVHSHATGLNSLKYKIIKHISDLTINKYADYYFACSEESGKWRFPANVLKDTKKFYVIKNGINVEKFQFNQNKRDEYKKKFNIENNKVLIHIGRFSKEKNQLYILDIFNEIIKIDNKFKLFLVGGTGPILDDIKNKIKELNLMDKVTILINRDDVNYLINMSDVFILPSLWEGLPFTGIEAQANGISCVFSDTISDEVNITKAYNKLSIQEAPKVWAKLIIELSNRERIDTVDDIKQKGYDISLTCKLIEKIYGGKNEDF